MLGARWILSCSLVADRASRCLLLFAASFCVQASGHATMHARLEANSELMGVFVFAAQSRKVTNVSWLALGEALKARRRYLKMMHRIFA